MSFHWEAGLHLSSSGPETKDLLPPPWPWSFLVTAELAVAWGLGSLWPTCTCYHPTYERTKPPPHPAQAPHAPPHLPGQGSRRSPAQSRPPLLLDYSGQPHPPGLRAPVSDPQRATHQEVRSFPFSRPQGTRKERAARAGHLRGEARWAGG